MASFVGSREAKYEVKEAFFPCHIAQVVAVASLLKIVFSSVQRWFCYCFRAHLRMKSGYVISGGSLSLNWAHEMDEMVLCRRSEEKCSAAWSRSGGFGNFISRLSGLSISRLTASQSVVLFAGGGVWVKANGVAWNVSCTGTWSEDRSAIHTAFSWVVTRSLVMKKSMMSG